MGAPTNIPQQQQDEAIRQQQVKSEGPAAAYSRAMQAIVAVASTQSPYLEQPAKRLVEAYDKYKFWMQQPAESGIQHVAGGGFVPGVQSVRHEQENAKKEFLAAATNFASELNNYYTNPYLNVPKDQQLSLPKLVEQNNQQAAGLANEIADATNKINQEQKKSDNLLATLVGGLGQKAEAAVYAPESNLGPAFFAKDTSKEYIVALTTQTVAGLKGQNENEAAIWGNKDIRGSTPADLAKNMEKELKNQGVDMGSRRVVYEGDDQKGYSLRVEKKM